MGLRSVKISKVLVENVFLSGSGAAIPKDPRDVKIKAVRMVDEQTLELLVQSPSFSGDEAVTTWDRATPWNPTFPRSAL